MHNKSNFFYRKMQENLLFDTDEFIKRPDSNQQEFEDLLIPYKGDIETASNEALGKLNEFMAANPKHHYLDSALPILYNGNELNPNCSTPNRECHQRFCRKSRRDCPWPSMTDRWDGTDKVHQR